MITFQIHELENSRGWFTAQKFPLHISEDSECTLWGRFVYFDRALLPGAGKGWGDRASRWVYNRTLFLNPIGRPGKQRLRAFLWIESAGLADLIRTLDTWIYTNKAEKRMRQIPFVWFIRSEPIFRAELLFPREDIEEQHE